MNSINKKKESLHAPNSIRTLSGNYVNVINPDPETILIEDIAHSLSMQPRFGGHLPQFYSVAQHSLWVAERLMHDTDLAYIGLMHDASEAYLLDMPSPIKKNLSEYKIIEAHLMNIIASKFLFNADLPKEVIDADREALEMEWNEIALNHNKDNNIRILTNEEAKVAFLDMFYLLKPY